MSEPDTWSNWHRFWALLFGRRMPTSGDRAHIGDLVVAYRPNQSTEGFGTKWSTDARRVIVIGDLWIFDYGDTQMSVFEPALKPSARELGDNNELLAENVRMFGYPSPSTSFRGEMNE